MEIINKIYTSAIVINDAGKSLWQLKDASYPFWPNRWATFGGGVKNGETPLECMIREFGVETGIPIKDFTLFCEKDFSDESILENKILRTGRIYYYSARISETDARKIKITEGKDYDFFDRWQLRRLKAQNSIVPYQHEVVENFLTV
ncbi:MAG: NUDIX hydrolase [Nanoarchaeota archaeon]